MTRVERVVRGVERPRRERQSDVTLADVGHELAHTILISRRWPSLRRIVPHPRFTHRRGTPPVELVTFDVRGYGRSSKPARVEDYRMVELVDDAVGLVHALGATTAAVIGQIGGRPTQRLCGQTLSPRWPR
jgi:pimeloyl-ACP methyl ester carboxylesterase